MKKVLIIGGFGFIGSHIAEKLIKNNYKVSILDINSMTSNFSKDVKYYKGSFLDANVIDEALSECDICIHCVSTTIPSTSNGNIKFDIESNLLGSINIFEKCIKFGVEKIIYLSSGGGVYGIPKRSSLDENHSTNPISSYGIVKLAVEKYLSMLCIGEKTKQISLRIANPYGPRQNFGKGQGVIGLFIDSIFKNNRVNIFGSLHSVRDYIYIEDLADAIIPVIDYSGEETIFNIGSGYGVSLEELVNSIESIVGKKILKDFFPARDFDPIINVLNVERANIQLNWAGKTNIYDGLIKTIEYYKNEKN